MKVIGYNDTEAKGLQRKTLIGDNSVSIEQVTKLARSMGFSAVCNIRWLAF